MSQESVEKEEAFICLQEDFDDLYNQTKIVQGLLTIAERENEKLRQEIAQLETVVQRQKEQLRASVVSDTATPRITSEVLQLIGPGQIIPLTDFSGQAE